MKIEPSLGDGDGRTDVDAFRNFRLESLGNQMPPRIERDDALRFGPLRERSDADGRIGVVVRPPGFGSSARAETASAR